MNRTKIIGTIGPSSDNKETFTQLVKSGLRVARLNLSHGDRDYYKKCIDLIKEVREELNIPVAILMDTRGPEIRTKNFVDGKVQLETGNKVTLCVGDFEGSSEKFCITYPNLYKDVKIGGAILIDDGLIELEVVSIEGSDIVCVIKNGGTVKNKKGINVPGASIKLPALTDKDIEEILFGITQGIDFVAASFIRKAEDVLVVRKLLDDNLGNYIKIISKVESQEGVDNIDEIIAVSDGVMIARGDLGVETPTEMIPLTQKMIIEKCNIEETPVITATQMLDSMIYNPRPTRAEVSDVANAILDGTDAIMLSGETAAGAYPVESVQVMKKVAETAEQSLDYKNVHKKIFKIKEKSVTNALSYSTCSTAMYLDAKAIICPTVTGKTAQMISMFRPSVPIVASTYDEVAQRQMQLLWGVTPVLVEKELSSEMLFVKSVHIAKDLNVVKEKYLVVITE